MNLIEIVLLAFGLAMDCFAVSIASGIILKRTLLRPMLVMAFFFGLFQALMPLIGWMGTSAFSHLIESVDHWIAFAILAFLGGRMVAESFKKEEEKHEYDPSRLKVILVLVVCLPGYTHLCRDTAPSRHHRPGILPDVHHRTDDRHQVRMQHGTQAEGGAVGRSDTDSDRD